VQPNNKVNETKGENQGTLVNNAEKETTSQTNIECSEKYSKNDDG